MLVSSTGYLAQLLDHALRDTLLAEFHARIAIQSSGLPSQRLNPKGFGILGAFKSC